MLKCTLYRYLPHRHRLGNQTIDLGHSEPQDVGRIMLNLRNSGSFKAAKYIHVQDTLRPEQHRNDGDPEKKKGRLCSRNGQGGRGSFTLNLHST